jgi:hypothetical protein
MTVPAGNVRPKAFSTGNVTGGEPISLGPIAGNVIYVLTAIIVSTQSTTVGDFAYVKVNDGIVAMAVIEEQPVLTTGLPAIDKTYTDITVEEFDDITVQPSAAGVTSWWIGGYFIAPEFDGPGV